MNLVADSLARPLRDLRISVTDRCNLRCRYCMPLDRYDWIERREVLTFEEIARIAAVCLRLGVERIRLTGGEPLLRRDLDKLVEQLSRLEGLRDLSLTTNGVLLADQAGSLKAAGLKRINVSLDTLDRDKFRETTRYDALPRVLEGLFKAKQVGLLPIKLNGVVEQGRNDGDILNLVEFARRNGFALRFIEFMDVGNSNNWVSERIVPKNEILRVIHARYPLKEIGNKQGSAPSVNHEFLDGIGDVGIIASVTEPFCGDCSRARVTADGKLVTCLFSERGYDLKGLIRSGATDAELLEQIRSTWQGRSDRYSVDRLEALKSPEGYQAQRRKIEMNILGG